MRTRQPAGEVSNALYLAMDSLADDYGNGTLRLTTRQAYQLHGVLKADLKTVFSTVIKNMGSTLAACGDVNRNVMAPAVPFAEGARPDYAAARKAAVDVADLLAPQSGAYYDVWLDGEKFVSVYKEDPAVTRDRAFDGFGTNYAGSPEPIYGAQFLPRKFKVAVTIPGDNSVDLFTNDLGIVVIMDEADATKVKGYNILVGGGMGRTHRNSDTFPRLADPLGFVPAADLFHAVKAVVAVQRDYGRRDDRKQARLKYLVHEWGLERFRSVTEQYMGKKFEAFSPLPAWRFEDYLGWGEQGDGLLYCGVWVQNGRLKGAPKRALRQVVEQHSLDVVLTPSQNLVLRNVPPSAKDAVDAALRASGLPTDPLASGGTGHASGPLDGVDRLSMACPALPLCGLAITEAERGLPDVNRRVRAMLTAAGLPATDDLVLRMTGCPNGCARPYNAELGFVGDGPNTYQLWIGGNLGQTRLASLYAERVRVRDLESELGPLFAMWAGERLSADERFGDFCERVGQEALRAGAAGSKYAAFGKAAAPSPVAAAMAASNGNGSSYASGNGNGNGGMDAATAAALAEAARKQGKSVGDLTREMLSASPGGRP